MWRQYAPLALALFIIFPIKTAFANSLEITPSNYFFFYQEFDQFDQLLDTEKGVLPGVKLSYGDISDSDSLRFNASIYEGRVDYTGLTQLGMPHQTETVEQLIKLGLSYTQHEQSHFPGLLFVGLHYWYWDRDILTRNAVQGLHELYTWYETEIGLRFNMLGDVHSGYWLELSAMYNFKPEMKLFLPSSEINFSLGSGPGYRIRASKNWTSNHNLDIKFSLFGEFWEFGRSNTVFTSDFFGSSGFLTEPDSQSFHSGLELSIIFKF